MQLSAATATTATRIFAHSSRDLLLVLGSLLHGAILAALVWSYLHGAWWCTVVLGLCYSYCITWNLNCISHNFLHNPFFQLPLLNRLFSLWESLVIGFSQTFYRTVHSRHHAGNNDRKNANGETHDWMSLYRYGRNGEIESVWAYTSLGYFRGNPVSLYREIAKRAPSDALQGLLEYTAAAALAAALLFVDWQLFVTIFLFHYAGHALSSLDGYYEHAGSNPDEPLAWGVSSYGRLYNLLWFNNGYHAEHHYRPREHWTRMPELHNGLADEMRRAGTRVLRVPHSLGFLESAGER